MIKSKDKTIIEKQPKLYDVYELSQLLNLSQNSVHKLIKKGVIKAHKIKNKYYADDTTIKAYKASQHRLLVFSLLVFGITLILLIILLILIPLNKK